MYKNVYISSKNVCWDVPDNDDPGVLFHNRTDVTNAVSDKCGNNADETRVGWFKPALV